MRHAALILHLVAAFLLSTPVAADQEGTDFFEKRIRPVLVEKCYGCHSAEADKLKAGLHLDSRAGTLRGGDRGPALVAGKPDASLLLRAIRYTDPDLQMPPKGKLPERVIQDFERWIASGAADPRSEESSASAQPDEIDFDAAKTFWSFTPPRRHETPKVDDAAWVRQPIDAFVLAKLEAAGLGPNPVADDRTLIRRLSFDLTGLPPRPEEVDTFVNDETPEKYERLVERLLASPHYGERLARLWLDVARYAEDQAHIVGNNKALFYPNAYLYRDWVIDAFSRDVPYDRFVELQLAADLLGDGAKDDRAALGFIGLGPKYYNRGDAAVKADEWEDRVDTVSRGLLGLTVACARCHDHKFDPVETEDYYALAGVFASTRMFNQPIKGDGKKNGDAKNPGQALHIIREGKPDRSKRLHSRRRHQQRPRRSAAILARSFAGRARALQGG